MRGRRHDVGVCLGLAVWTIIAFGDLLWGAEYGFVTFDDPHYVVYNGHVHAGLSGQSVWWALTSFDALNWHPLTWISLQLDFTIHGLNPRGFHATNLLLHVANTLLLFLVLRRSTADVWPSAAAAALFALHPLHVESVAWITERKDVLSTFFWMLTLAAYVRYTRNPGPGRYCLVLLCLALGLMSKPMVVTLPCVLLLYDYWPLRRWPGSLAQCAIDAHGKFLNRPPFAPASVRQLVVEKIPMMLLALGSSVLTIQAGRRLIEDANRHLGFGDRVLNALTSYLVYLRQMFWPSDLAVLYLHPESGTDLAKGLVAGGLVAALTCLAMYLRKRRPYLLVGWLWYLGTLVPVIGLLQAGRQAHADRFTYVPLIGVFIALVWAVAEWSRERRLGRFVAAGATVALLGACTVISWSQLRCWRNSDLLWTRALEMSGEDPRLHFIVASEYLKNGDTHAALGHAQRLITLQPDDPDSHRLLAVILERSLKIEEAVASMKRAVELRPDSADIRRHLAKFLWLQGRIPAANDQHAAIARLEPLSAEGQNHHGLVAQRNGQYADAVRHLEEAVRLAPDNALYRCDLALALEDHKEWTAAQSEFRTALNTDPDCLAKCGALAWMLATHPNANRRDGVEAVRRARQVCSITRYRHPPFLAALAAAYAEAGQFDKAIATGEDAHRLALQAEETNFANQVGAALKLYRRGQPFRDGTQQ